MCLIAVGRPWREAGRLHHRRRDGKLAVQRRRAGRWLPHTARARISNFGKTDGLQVSSEKHPERGRVYRVAA